VGEGGNIKKVRGNSNSNRESRYKVIKKVK